MPFAGALSEHPVTSLATGEVIGAVLEDLGERPDLAVVTVTRPHLGALDDIAAAVEAVLHPMAVIGCAAESVVGTGREVEETPSVSLWAARVGPLVPVALRATRLADGDWHFTGWPASLAFVPSALVLVADPFTFPSAEFLAWVGRRHPGLPVVGGNASAGAGPGGNRLVTGARTVSEGAVGVLLGAGVEVATVVSQGARPYGQPLTVTRSERNIVHEVAGRPALEALVGQITDDLAPVDVAGLEANGFHIGRLVDEHLEEAGPGDFLVRSVTGVDHASGAIAVDDRMPVGCTVRFHLRDPAAADRDLRAALAGRSADGVLLCTCNGRGTRFFDEPDHDAAAVADALGPVPVGGFSAAGEFGPVGGTNFLHTFTASMALLSDR
jgi:small ligand-binding sensory domain FIST